MAAASDAADPSSGTATIARLTFMPPPVWNPGSGWPSSGRLDFPHAPDLPAVGGEGQVGEPEPGAVRGQRRGRAAGRARPVQPLVGEVREDEIEAGPVAGTGRYDWPPYSCTRLRAYHGAGSSSRGAVSPAGRRHDRDAAALGGAALLPPHFVARDGGERDGHRPAGHVRGADR